MTEIVSRKQALSYICNLSSWQWPWYRFDKLHWKTTSVLFDSSLATMYHEEKLKWQWASRQIYLNTPDKHSSPAGPRYTDRLALLFQASCKKRSRRCIPINLSDKFCSHDQITKIEQHLRVFSRLLPSEDFFLKNQWHPRVEIHNLCSFLVFDTEEEKITFEVTTMKQDPGTNLDQDRKKVCKPCCYPLHS